MTRCGLTLKLKHRLLAASLAALACAAGATTVPVSAPFAADPATGAAQLLDSTADTTIQRLPTCETAIRTRVSSWKAAAAIACRKSAGTDVPACVDARLRFHADQLRRLRSCKSL